MGKALSILVFAGGWLAAIAAEPPPAAKAPPGLSLLGRGFEAIQSDDLQVGAIFDFTAAGTRHRGGATSRDLEFRELELSLGARLAPTIRFDIFLGAHRHDHAHAHGHGHDGHDDEDDHGDGHDHEDDDHENGHHHHGECRTGPLSRGYYLTRGYRLEVEEAFFTFTGLPGGLKARVGKFRAAMGWANTQHPHALPWYDYPLVTRNFLGHHNLAGVGAELSWLAPWDQPYSELVYQLFRTSGESYFGTESWHDKVHLVHLKNVFDLSPSSTLQVGLSGATGPARCAEGGGRGSLGGIDLTYRWRPVQGGLYRSFAWRSELLASRRPDEHGHRRSAWGFYTGPEYQFARRWAVGGRLDYSQLPENPRHHERGGSVHVTFRPNEYCFWRAGIQRTSRNFELDGAKGDTMLFLQLNFGLGAHRAHTY